MKIKMKMLKASLLEIEIKKQDALEEESKEFILKSMLCSHCKKTFFETTKSATTTASGLTYKIIKSGIKPVDGSTFYFHYAGYFEDGNLFDSSYEDVNKAYGKYDAKRAAQNGYQAFPFEAGKKKGMIQDFWKA
jgi:FKBP-type peptidyl-prolyl cis-trans isomerase